MKKWIGFFGAIVILALTACHSTPLMIPSAPLGPNEQRLGTGEGSSTGIMLFQFIPINQNDRFVDAYRQALAQSGGTTTRRCHDHRAVVLGVGFERIHLPCEGDGSDR